MKCRKLIGSMLIAAMLVFATSIAVLAVAPGNPTPLDQIHAEMFPAGSQQRVDYTPAAFVRSGPFPDHAIVASLVRGADITVLEYRDKWVRVDTPSGQGWLYAGFLSRDMAAAPPLATRPEPLTPEDRTPSSILLSADLFPIGSTATIDFIPAIFARSGPGNDYAVVATINRGTEVTILDYNQLWARIDTPSGQGWIFSGFLSNDAVLAARAGL